VVLYWRSGGFERFALDNLAIANQTT